MSFVWCLPVKRVVGGSTCGYYQLLLILCQSLGSTVWHVGCSGFCVERHFCDSHFVLTSHHVLLCNSTFA